MANDPWGPTLKGLDQLQRVRAKQQARQDALDTQAYNRKRQEAYDEIALPKAQLGLEAAQREGEKGAMELEDYKATRGQNVTNNLNAGQLKAAENFYKAYTLGGDKMAATMLPEGMDPAVLDSVERLPSGMLRRNLGEDEWVDSGYVGGKFQTFHHKPEGAEAGATPYFRPIVTDEGVYSFDARKGTAALTKDEEGRNITDYRADPSLQGKIAGSKAGAKVKAVSKAQAQIDLPRLVMEGERNLELVDNLLDHPGFKQAVGASRLFQLHQIPGTDAKSFDIALEQLMGKQFLEAFQSLKGGGQITEIEGQKATDALSRMKATNKEEEFIKAARDYQNVIRRGLKVARMKAGEPEKKAKKAPKAALAKLYANPYMIDYFEAHYGYRPEGF